MGILPDWLIQEQIKIEPFAEALALAGTEPERRFLTGRLAEIRGSRPV